MLALEMKILRAHVEDDLKMEGHPNRVDTDKLRPIFDVFSEVLWDGKR
jgi:hypothetical protein